MKIKIALFFVILILFSYSNEVDRELTITKIVKEKRKLINEISPNDLREMFKTQKEFVLIDVREKEETEVFSIYKSENIPRGVLEFKIEKLYPNKDVEIIIYCQKGSRGVLATNTLIELGYKNVKNLSGGADKWLKEIEKLNAQEEDCGC